MTAQQHYPVFGEQIEASDYRKANSWLSLPGLVATPEMPEPVGVAATQPRQPVDAVGPKAGEDLSSVADVFFCYPTAWRAAEGEYPICSLDRAEMRQWADFYLRTRASAFATAGRLIAPYYRQLDARFALSGQQADHSRLASGQPGARAAEAASDNFLTQRALADSLALIWGVPYADVRAAFDYYIRHVNAGRPYILVGHSQGSAVLLGLLSNYLAQNRAVYQRMVAAYLIGLPISRDFYAAYPHLRPARSADDLGTIISYNTQAPLLDGPNPLASPDSLLINPVSWLTDATPAPASQSLGSVLAGEEDGRLSRLGAIASARIDPTQGVVVCDVDRELFSSSAASRAYFPLGVLHENDIPLYYYDLRANAELRLRSWLARQP
ncbi:MAG: DUF3089 domain-containing protein [Coriobacteriales bacterium]|jgi:hypothetical protein|nr:DUF3089 domain-containing protein [Coriobacteriales bacterium]